MVSYNDEILLVIELGSIIPDLNLIKKIISKMPIGIILFESNKLSKLLYYVLGVIDYYRRKFGKFGWW